MEHTHTHTHTCTHPCTLDFLRMHISHARQKKTRKKASIHRSKGTIHNHIVPHFRIHDKVLVQTGFGGGGGHLWGKAAGKALPEGIGTTPQGKAMCWCCTQRCVLGLHSPGRLLQSVLSARGPERAHGDERHAQKSRSPLGQADAVRRQGVQIPKLSGHQSVGIDWKWWGQLWAAWKGELWQVRGGWDVIGCDTEGTLPPPPPSLPPSPPSAGALVANTVRQQVFKCVQRP